MATNDIYEVESWTYVPDEARCRIKINHAYTLGVYDDGDNDAWTTLHVRGASVRGISAVNASWTGPRTTGTVLTCFERYVFSPDVAKGCKETDCSVSVHAEAYGGFQAMLTTGKGSCSGTATLRVLHKDRRLEIRLDGRKLPGGDGIKVNVNGKAGGTLIGQGGSASIDITGHWQEAEDQQRAVLIDPVALDDAVGGCSFRADAMTSLAIGATNGSRFNDTAVTRVNITNRLSYNSAAMTIDCDCTTPVAPAHGHGQDHPHGHEPIPPGQGSEDLPRTQGLALRAALAELGHAAEALAARSTAAPAEPLDLALRQQALRAADLVFTAEQAAEFSALRDAVAAAEPAHPAAAAARASVRLEAHAAVLDHLAGLSAQGWHHHPAAVERAIGAARGAITGLSLHPPD